MKEPTGDRKGILYLVSTPIGNLKDITIRALEVLKAVQLVAAEDTRRARILLTAYGIRATVTSLFKDNEDKKSSLITERLLNGDDVAYISDAGTPGISDPGYLLTRRAIDCGIKVVPIPGASAVVTGLCAAGVPGGSFIFDGFIPSGRAARRRYFAGLEDEPRPVILFESPRRLKASLVDMREVLGDRHLILLRELTKLFEEIIRGRISEMIESESIGSLKGEITLIVLPEERRNDGDFPAPEEIKALFSEAIRDGACSDRDAVALIARRLNAPRRRIYNLILGANREKPLAGGEEE